MKLIYLYRGEHFLSNWEPDIYVFEFNDLLMTERDGQWFKRLEWLLNCISARLTILEFLKWNFNT